MTTFEGKTAVITGASSGIGRALTLALLREGAAVAACGRSAQRLDDVRTDAGTAADRLLTTVCDVGDETQLTAFTRQTVEAFGGIDIVVANAGFGVFRPLTELRTDEFDAMINTNVRGVFLTLRHTVPVMISRGGGDAVIVSSLAGKNGFAGGTGYSTSKFAVRGLAQSLMLEVRKHNVRVVSVFPGSTDTAFFDGTPMSPNREKILRADDVAASILDALRTPRRALISEIDIRPSDPS
ncbi:MAG: SDR family NAD(P)-dependent oxidoreductase [Bacteroidia bacterium]|nr:SDR family NAD(P)-dependent oxidoreductase [Bacteroidia bacterium]